MIDFVPNYKELRVYTNAIEAAMEPFEITRSFPVGERSLEISTQRPKFGLSRSANIWVISPNG